MSYELATRRPAEATAELQWEELSVPWTIKVEKPEEIYLTKLRQELTTVPGFNYQGYVTAAQYLLTANTHLDLALEWAEDAISRPFIGQANFNTLSTKARVLSKLGRDSEAARVMQTAVHLPATTAVEIHQYARQLQADKRKDEAIAMFKYNAARSGDAWPVHVGLARAYAAEGDTRKALKHAQKALPQAPDPVNRQSLESMIKTFLQGHNITQ